MAGGYLRSLGGCHFNPEESFVGQIWHNTKYLETSLLITQMLLWLKCVPWNIHVFSLSQNSEVFRSQGTASFMRLRPCYRKLHTAYFFFGGGRLPLTPWMWGHNTSPLEKCRPHQPTELLKTLISDFWATEMWETISIRYKPSVVVA